MREKGNALVETVVLVSVLGPLMVGLPLLGKVSDINNSTIQSSRYIAWERTIGNTSSEVEVKNRFFSRPDLSIRSGEGALSGADANNPYWTGYGVKEDGSVNTMFDEGQGMALHFRERRAPGAAGELSSAIVRMGRSLELEDKGLFTATVAVGLGTNRFLPSGDSCSGDDPDETFACISRSNTILVDGWEVDDASHAEDRTKAFVMASALEEVGDFFATVVSKFPFFRDLEELESDGDGGFGYVDSEVVPLDRFLEPG